MRLTTREAVENVTHLSVSSPSNSALCGSVAVNSFWHSHVQKKKPIRIFPGSTNSQTCESTQNWRFIVEVQGMNRLLCWTLVALKWYGRLITKKQDSEFAQLCVEMKCGQRIGTVALLLSFSVHSSFLERDTGKHTETDTQTQTHHTRLPSIFEYYSVPTSCWFPAQPDP